VNKFEVKLPSRWKASVGSGQPFLQGVSAVQLRLFDDDGTGFLSTAQVQQEEARLPGVEEKPGSFSYQRSIIALN
jgi:hypothetical protein